MSKEVEQKIEKLLLKAADRNLSDTQRTRLEKKIAMLRRMSQ